MNRDEYEEEFIQRTKALRLSANLTQQQMAELLNCGAEAYRKYETRTPMPAYLMVKFVLVVGSDLDFLVSGHRRVRRTGAAEVTKLQKKGRG